VPTSSNIITKISSLNLSAAERELVVGAIVVCCRDSFGGGDRDEVGRGGGAKKSTKQESEAFRVTHFLPARVQPESH
jgi:hypothetical protein